MGLGHGWSSRFGFARWVTVNVAMPVVIGWILLDVFVRGDPVGLHVILGFVAAWMIIVAIDTLARGGMLNQSGVDDGWGRTDHRFAPGRLVRKMYNAHQRTFPLAVRQRGTIGRDITAVRRRGQGRQGGRRRQGGSPVKKASSDDGPGEPGEPPLPTQLFLSFLDLAMRWSCASKTLRNQVTTGKLPRPIQLPIGPRFPIACVEAIERGEWQSCTTEAKSDQASPAIKKRGRPRIAQTKKLITSTHRGDQ